MLIVPAHSSRSAASGVVEKAEIMIEKAEELGMSISDYIDMYGEKDQAEAGVPLFPRLL